jgi:hypothetical protein
MKTLTFEVSDALYEAFQQMAARYGKPLEAVALEWLVQHPPGQPPQLTDQERPEAWARLLRHAGAVSLGHPTDVRHESIDADLARASDNGHGYETR